MGLVSMLYSYPRQNFDITFPQFSRYTFQKGDCVPGEQQEGEAETLSHIGADHGN
jgi:hypothetical protein